jgi:NTP pyrophosphatase (non-canonical NTP hydrolase)
MDQPITTTLPPDHPVSLREFQALIRSMFGAKDAARGVDGTFMWFLEEVGELAGSLRKGPKEELALEFADVLAWLVTLANIAGVDLDDAVKKKYGTGCPRCGRAVCECGLARKP